ncbi:MAG: EFR1 family ferrodoxin [Dehalobacterium sp.]|jgi:ferredoxin
MDHQLNVLYFSPTDTTAKTVKSIACGINDTYKEYNITLPHNRNSQILFEENDLVIVGVPVYAGRVPAFLIDYFKKIKGNNTLAVCVVVYGNRDYDDALLELRDILEINGFIGITAGAFIGEHSYTNKVGTGRPDQADLEIARKFGMKIKELLTQLIDQCVNNIPVLSVKGNSPYKERATMPPTKPDTSDQCISCGICAEHCPTGAIDPNDYSEVDASKCIRCCSCVKKCPVNAKAYNHELIQKFAQYLIDKFSTVRHEPELFI